IIDQRRDRSFIQAGLMCYARSGNGELMLDGVKDQCFVFSLNNVLVPRFCHRIDFLSKILCYVSLFLMIYLSFFFEYLHDRWSYHIAQRQPTVNLFKKWVGYIFSY